MFVMGKEQSRFGGIRAWTRVLALALIFAVVVGEPPARAATPQPAETEGIGLRPEANKTLESIKKLDKDFYTIDYTVDYGLDELLEKGVESPEALYTFISNKMVGGLPFNFPPIRLACSTFFSVTPEGEYVLARNMDLSYAQNFLVHTKPKNGYESLSVVSGHLMGYTDSLPDSKLGRLWTLAAPYFPIDGINEKGLSVAILMVADDPVHQDTGKPPFTTTLAIRYMLDKAANVDEAIALMKRHDMRSVANSNFHYHVTDAQGNSAVIEYVDNEISVIRPSGHGQVVTNFYLTPEKTDAVIDGQDRLEILQKALDESEGVVDMKKAWRMLDSVKMVHDFDEETGIDFMTAYSILYNNSRRSMSICVDANFDKVHEFTIEGWGK